jgi:hypothetical protein
MAKEYRAHAIALVRRLDFWQKVAREAVARLRSDDQLIAELRGRIDRLKAQNRLQATEIANLRAERGRKILSESRMAG